MHGTLHLTPLSQADRLVQALTVLPAGLLLISQSSAQTWQQRLGEFLKVNETRSKGLVQLALSHRDSNSVTTTIVVGGNNAETGVWRYAIFAIVDGTQRGHQTYVEVPDPSGRTIDIKRETLPQASKIVTLSTSSFYSYFACSLYQGWLHIYAIIPSPDHQERVNTGIFDLKTRASDQFQGGKYYEHMQVI